MRMIFHETYSWLSSGKIFSYILAIFIIMANLSILLILSSERSPGLVNTCTVNSRLLTAKFCLMMIILAKWMKKLFFSCKNKRHPVNGYRDKNALFDDGDSLPGKGNSLRSLA